MTDEAKTDAPKPGLIQRLTAAGSGARTYVAGGGLVVLGVGVLTGYASLSEEQLAGVLALLGGAGLVALRAAVGKLGLQLPEKSEG